MSDPESSEPTCSDCNTSESLLWQPQSNGGQLCNDCYLAATDIKTEDDEETEGKCDDESTPAKISGRNTRKSTRSTRFKPKTPIPVPKPPAPRGRGRRSLFKRLPLKAPTATATVVTSESIFFKGIYMQVGDIVSVSDISEGTFYAQIRGFMTDQYCEKSAVLTWLLPTKASCPPEMGFDPSTYVIGPEEELPRKLEYMDFVMHAPSDYYKASNSPYPLTDQELNNYTGFIWTSIEAKDKDKDKT